MLQMGVAKDINSDKITLKPKSGVQTGNWEPLIAERDQSHAYFCEKMSTNFG
jgi:hypothetical protein